MKRRDFIKGAGIAAGAGVAAAASSTLSTPAIAQERIPMVMVSTWPRDFPGLGTGAQRFAQRVADLSEGRIQVEYYAAGERVGAFDSFDEVASGNAQAYHGADYYWKGKHPGWAYFTTVPFGLTYTEINAWIRFMGGDVMAKLGASPVSLPGGQIYENLVSGSIDATEWVGPWNDYAMKFYEAAKYYYYPGFHEPGSMLAVGMNKSWWEGLSDADKLLIESAASMENDVMMSEYNAKNGQFLAKLIDEQGVELKRFNDDVYDSFGAASAEVFEEARAHSDLANRIHESFLRAREEVGSWANLADSAYVAQRNRVLGM
jgi:TRAP-type mannitol/chloroaromatic compound transport system substrate-binding protein